jgi:hypothetical protein
MRYWHNWESEREGFWQTRDFFFDKLERKTKRGWDYSIIERVKEWEKKKLEVVWVGSDMLIESVECILFFKWERKVKF